MATETQTQRGRCATHGEVQATREMPRMSFPVIVYAIRRSMAKKRPYLCPECGNPVQPL